MMFIYKAAKFAPVWITIPQNTRYFVHQALTEHQIPLRQCQY